MAVKKLKYIITGTGRCGTCFFARFLTSVGIPCGHEFVFGPSLDDVPKKLKRDQSKLSHVSKKDDEPSWVDESTIIADSSLLAAPYLDHRSLKGCKIIHLVRNPLSVISSFVLDGDYFEDCYAKHIWEHFIYTHLPDLTMKMSAMERAAIYYVEWNNMIENKTQNADRLLFRIDKDDMEVVTKFLNISPSVLTNSFSDKTCNTWRKRRYDITYKEIPLPARDRLLKMAESYGYCS
jgi:hypothetical protein